MSHSEQPDTTFIILGTTFCITVVGSVLGAVTALSFWGPDHFKNMLAGLATGAVTALPIGFFMAWHGCAMARSPSRAALAGAWGVIPSGLIGMSIGPFLGGIMGIAFGHLVAGGIFGLVAGPFLGIFAWELAYWADELLESFLSRGKA